MAVVTTPSSSGIEFADTGHYLITCAIFYKMFQKVGHVKKESERLERSRRANSLTKGFSECHRSHKGLFVGLLLFMATLVTTSLFLIFYARRRERRLAITLYQCTELVLLGVSTFTCFAATLRLRILKFCDLSEEGAFDDNLLLIGLLGMLFYNIFILVPALGALPSEEVAAYLFVAKALLEMFQSMLQVVPDDLFLFPWFAHPILPKHAPRLICLVP
ncbi:unnamed protein product [Protopolystoma xenopodis]|uniref:Uncharacterized protein n=1 Tax=Protopolystoma xenopodis TaxID=117903 RepID=A0A448X381_9PLAT|nr:unnamed protein product [Protopolystoma xenopodis]